jgi:hypothetical protein
LLVDETKYDPVVVVPLNVCWPVMAFPVSVPVTVMVSVFVVELDSVWFVVVSFSVVVVVETSGFVNDPVTWLPESPANAVLVSVCVLVLDSVWFVLVITAVAVLLDESAL